MQVAGKQRLKPFFFFFFFLNFKVFIEFVTIWFWFSGGQACGILTSQPGIEPAPPALEGGLNHWTTKEVP